VYKSLIYNFLITVPNKHSIPSTQPFTLTSYVRPTNQLSIILYRYISIISIFKKRRSHLSSWS